MKFKIEKLFASMVVLALASTFALGCGNGDEEMLKKEIQNQIKMIERQVTGLEQQQDEMIKIIDQMQTQLTAMKDDLNTEGRKLRAANEHVAQLRNLTTIGLGNTPFEDTLKESEWSRGQILTLILCVLVVWVLYRMRARSNEN